MDDQPMPVPNDHPPIHDLVAAEIMQRKEIGISRYGTPLQPFNHRDSGRDMEEEVYDLAVYLKQDQLERAALLAAIDDLENAWISKDFHPVRLAAEKLFALRAKMKPQEGA